MMSVVPSPVPIVFRRLRRAGSARGGPAGLRHAGRLAALLACGILLAGCVHRRMTIRSDPPGAQVLVDGEPIGYTPASTDFTYYGTREIRLIKPGYETLTVLQPVPTPWYQIPPLDFFTDNLLPFRVTNRHDFTYTLQPKRLVPTTELLERANGLRSEAQMGP